MITIAGSSKDAYTKTGYDYFISKYGFSGTDINNHVIFDQNLPSVNSFNDEIQGWITWDGYRLPVFIPPADLNNRGSPVLTFSHEHSTYPCAVINERDIIISLDIFRHLGLFISGSLEKTWARQKGERENIIGIPFADYYSDILFSYILQAREDNNQLLVHKAFWPDGKTFAVCLTHDVDEIRKTYQWLTYPARQIIRHDWSGLKKQIRSFSHKLRGDEPFWTFERLTRLEESYGVRSSLFFLHESGKVSLMDKKTWRHAGRRYDFSNPRVLGVIQDLYLRNWDIGLHGSFYSFDNEALLRSEKTKLEQSLGHEVYGGRQHNLNLRIPDTWRYQENAGLSYDSTLGYNDCIGFRWGLSFPFRPYFPEENRLSSVLQIPLVIEDLPYFRSSTRWEDFLDIFRNVNASGGMITLLWHHSVFNEYEFPGWAQDYARIIEYCLKNNAWITDAKSIALWWMEREKAQFASHYRNGILRIIPESDVPCCYLKIHLSENKIISQLENAKIITNSNNTVIIRTSPLHRTDCVSIELSELSHGN